MKKIASICMVTFVSTTLVACSTNLLSQNSNDAKVITTSQAGANGQETVTGGNMNAAPVGAAMDQADKEKMWRALDNAPGKATQWVSSSNGASYTVTPIQKVTVNGNDLCRTYKVVAVSGGSTRESGGTACIATDGNWHGVGN